MRKDYGKRWGRLTQPNVNEFYNPNYLCDEFRNRWKKGEKNELERINPAYDNFLINCPLLSLGHRYGKLSFRIRH